MSGISTHDEALLRRALSLAERGLYTTDPNPRVACIIARGETIVGEGWHERAGGPHAEVQPYRPHATVCGCLDRGGTGASRVLHDRP
jgi:pyrimidine deaminase RibD-like protein